MHILSSEKMKKTFFILFSLTVLVASTFADKSQFYKNEKVIDTMYVNAEDGLRVRDKPSLKSNRLCGLPHRLPVKVVAIGKEETIDGITAPWVEILIPRYEWKNKDVSEFGWVFGGYLSEEIPVFATPSNAAQLKQYLESSFWRFWFENGDGATIYYGYFKDNVLYAFPEWYKFHDEKKIEFEKLTSFKAVSKDSFYSDEYYWIGKRSPYSDEKIVNYLFVEGTTKLTHITETFMQPKQMTYEEKKEFDCEGMVWDLLEAKRVFLVEDKTFGDKTRFDSGLMLNGKGLYALIDGKNLIQTMEEEKKSFNSDFAIRSGISAAGTSYEKDYHDYWNPIMAEHQKMADEMK